MLLEVGRDVALRAGERLLAGVVVGHAIALRVGNLDVVAEDAVVADPQRPDAGSLALRSLQRGQVGARAAPRSAETVEVRVGALPHGATVRRVCGKVLCQERVEAFAQAGGRLTVGGASGDVASRGQSPGRERRRIERAQRVANRAEVARRGNSLHASCDEALEVAHTAERVTQAAAGLAVGEQCVDRVEASRDRVDIVEGLVEPGSQQPHTHGGPGCVEDAGGATRRCRRDG